MIVYDNEPIPCDRCNSTGWISIVKDGRETAQKCDCQIQDSYLKKGEKANVPPRFMGVNLENYYPAPDNPSQKNAKKVVKQFIDDYPAVYKGLMLQGTTGVGKTRLICTIATELMQKDKDIDIFYIDWNDLVREMRSGVQHTTRDYSAINHLVYRLASVDLLLFDELGAATATSWILDNIYYLFNRRYNDQKITICASNYLDKSVNNQETLTQRIGERIRSRLYEMTDIVKIGGNDLRAT